MRETRELIQFSAKVAVRALLAISLFALLFMGIGPRFFDYQTLTVLTGSMTPRIDPGSVVVVVPVQPDRIRPGDIITFTPPGDEIVITHRVMTVNPDPAGGIAVTTKGDANTSTDPWVARIAGQDVYRVRWVVPTLGRVISTLRSPLVNRLLVLALPLILALIWLRQIWDTPSTSSPVAGAGRA
ncbi:MAG TPA: signal peptidase I [Actinomycetota bacterium]|nr:signal peptidase I [Actinomycetota bacterium]